MPELKRIDAHQHYWRISRGDYDWMTHDMSSIRRDYLPGDLVPTLLRHNFYGSIAVQAAATYEETNFLIDLAASDSTILGVVGWIDPYDGQWLTRIEAYRRIPKWRGYRLMVEYTENTYSLLEGTSKELLMYSSLENIPIDILVRCDQLSFLLDVIDRFPNLRIILDHMGKPTMQPRDFARWAEYIKVIASNENVYVKISGMVTEAKKTYGYYAPDLNFHQYIDHVVDVFGLSRIVFGSDWPVCLLATSYSEVVGIIERYVQSRMVMSSWEGLWGTNAAEFYGLQWGG